MKFFGFGDKKAKSSKTSPSGLVLNEKSVLNQLKQIIDPDLKKNIVDAGFVHDLVIKVDEGFVSLRLVLTTPACPIKETFRTKTIEVLKEIPGVKNVDVTMDAAKPKGNQQKINTNPLGSVTNIVAVASGKGGVGKSTSSVYLAYSLAKGGAKVGLIDADIYGPSLCKMLGVGKPTAMDGDLIIPPEKDGIKVISGAMFSSADKAQILRGPLAGNLVKQFMTQVKWGELDYLLIDYPPGTGDIQLTISQIASLDASVLVTTPQEVATADVIKCVDMFNTLNVPILGVIETMSYFTPEDAPNRKYRIFGEGGGKKLASKFGFPVLAEIPIEPEVCRSGDHGRNQVRDGNSSLAASSYQKASESVVRALATWKNSGGSLLTDFQLNWRLK